MLVYQFISRRCPAHHIHNMQVMNSEEHPKKKKRKEDDSFRENGAKVKVLHMLGWGYHLFVLFLGPIVKFYVENVV